MSFSLKLDVHGLLKTALHEYLFETPNLTFVEEIKATFIITRFRHDQSTTLFFFLFLLSYKQRLLNHVINLFFTENFPQCGVLLVLQYYRIQKSTSFVLINVFNLIYSVFRYEYLKYKVLVQHNSTVPGSDIYAYFAYYDTRIDIFNENYNRERKHFRFR